MTRSLLGVLVLVAMLCAAGAGILALRGLGGGGQRFSVTFKDSRGIDSGDSIVFMDRIVGRVYAVDEGDDETIVRGVIAAEEPGLLRKGSRFWIREFIGASVLHFNEPDEAGAVEEGEPAYVGLEEAPPLSPDDFLPRRPGKLQVRPVWLCETRFSATVTADGGVLDIRRKSAGAVIAQGDAPGELLVLAPSWLVGTSGEVISLAAFVEFPGGETLTAKVAYRGADLCILRVTGSAWKGTVAPLWAEGLRENQPLVLLEFEGLYYKAEHDKSGLAFRGVLDGGYIALVDGHNLCGFALPRIGKTRGADWTPLHGLADALAQARSPDNPD